MVLRCKECGEVIEVHAEITSIEADDDEKTATRHAEFMAHTVAPMCPDCRMWAWEILGDGDEEEDIA